MNLLTMSSVVSKDLLGGMTIIEQCKIGKISNSNQDVFAEEGGPTKRVVPILEESMYFS